MNYEEMMEMAKNAAKNSYCPYSKFAVGACILTENDKIFTGCNFENASFGLTICAERNAVGSAITAGEKKFKAIAIYSPNMQNCTPCGACRQVLSEFQANGEMDVITTCEEGLRIHKLNELLPENFVL